MPRAPPALTGTISMPIGVVSLAERYGGAMFTPGGFEAMVAEVTARLGAFEQIHRIGQEIAQGGVSLLGTSGTVTTLAGIVLGLQCYQRPLVDGQVLTRADAMAAVDRSVLWDAPDWPRIPASVPNERNSPCPAAPSSPPSTVNGGPTLTVADRGLREGLLVRLMRDAAGRPA